MSGSNKVREAILLTHNQMMAAMNITALEGLGYDTVQGLSDPTDSRFVAQDWSEEAYADSSIQSTLSYLGGLGAYNQVAQITSAIEVYYSTNPGAAVETGISTTTTQPYGNQATHTQGNGWWGHGAAPTQTQDWQSHQGWGQWGQRGHRPGPPGKA